MGEIATGGNFICCLIIVVIFMGLGGAYNIGWRQILKSSYDGQAAKGWDYFLLGESPLKAPCKYFNFAIIGGMKCMNWFKNGAGKGFIFHAIIPLLYPL